GQCLNAVVFEQGAVIPIGSRLEHGVGHKTAGLPVLRGIRVSNDAVFLNRFRRNTGDTAGDRGPSATLALIVVVVAIYHEIAHARPGSVDSRASRGARDRIGNRSRKQIDELIRVTIL